MIYFLVDVRNNQEALDCVISHLHIYFSAEEKKEEKKEESEESDEDMGFGLFD